MRNLDTQHEERFRAFCRLPNYKLSGERVLCCLLCLRGNGCVRGIDVACALCGLHIDERQ
jgi:hypothetical protein